MCKQLQTFIATTLLSSIALQSCTSKLSLKFDQSSEPFKSGRDSYESEYKSEEEDCESECESKEEDYESECESEEEDCESECESEGEDYEGREGELIQAVKQGNATRVRELLDQGFNPNLKYGINDTPLIIAAAARGHRTTLETLLDGGADKEAEDKYGNTALIKAARGGKLDVLSLLLDNGASTQKKDKAGNTVLIAAAKKAKTSSSEYMETLLSIFNLLLDRDPHLINKRDNDGWTALIWLLHGRDCRVAIELLLDRDAAVDRADRDGYTPLMIAASKGYLSEVQLLLEKGANGHLRNREGKNASELASQRGHVEVVRLLSGR